MQVYLLSSEFLLSSAEQVKKTSALEAEVFMQISLMTYTLACCEKRELMSYF